MFGNCVSCPVCGGTVSITTELNAAIRTLGSAQSATITSSVSIASTATFTAAAGVLTELSDTNSAITTLVMGTAGASAAALSVIAGNKVTVTTLTSACNSAIVVAPGGSIAVTTMTVTAALYTSIAFKTGATTQPPVSTISSINLMGSLILSGDGKAVFPASSTGTSTISVSSGGLIQVGGGVKLSGNVGDAPIFLGGISDANDRAAVAVADTLRTQANILGSGVISVKGTLVAKCRTIAADLEVQGTGQFNEGGNTTIESALFTGAGLSLSFAATLVLAQPSTLIKFGTITQCSANSVIQIRTKSLASLQTGVYTAMSYSSATSVTNLNCNVEIKDDSGKIVTLMKKAPAAGRRLLAEGEATYAWEDDGLSYSYTNTNGAGVVQASLLIVALSVLAAVFAA
jgi:hypothetical protein